MEQVNKESSEENQFKPQYYSNNEVDEVLGQVPSQLIRYGTSILFALILSAFALTWFIEYPDTVEGSLSITTSKPPYSVVTLSDGRLSKSIVKDGGKVRYGDNMAFIESTADHTQILNLSKQLSTAEALLRKGKMKDFMNLSLVNYSRLGELQIEYQQFIKQYSQLKSFLKNGFHKKEKEILIQELETLKILDTSLIEQMNLQKVDINLSEEEYNINEQLLREKVISKLDLNHEQSKKINKIRPFQVLKFNLINNKINQFEKKKEILSLDREMHENINTFIQNLYTLQSSLSLWKQKYILSAPTSGEVIFPDVLYDGQLLKKDQVIYYIIPYSTKNVFFGEMIVGQGNFGKIRIEQTVLVKLPSYPYQEYGFLVGRVRQITKISSNSKYRIQVEFPNGMQTSTGKVINFTNGLVGDAQIVTVKSRLIEKILLKIVGVTKQ